MDIASGRDNWRQDRERESEGGKEGERDREVDDRGSGLSRSRCGSPARALRRRCRHTKCAPTDSARSLPAVPCVPPNAQGGMWVVHRTCRLASHAGEGRAQNQTGRTRQTDTRGSGGERAGADTRRVDTIDAAACHHPPQRERERERGQQRPDPHGQPPPPAAAAAVVVPPRLPGVRNCGVGQTRRGRCRRRLQTDSHTGAGVRGTRGKGGSADTGDMRRGGAAARRMGRGAHSPCGRLLSCRRGTVLMGVARADTNITHT